MKLKLKRIHSSWHRRLLSVSVETFLLLEQLSTRSTWNAHWVGKRIEHARRLHPMAEWLALGCVLLIGVLLINDSHAGMLWITSWELVLSVYVIILSFVQMIAANKGGQDVRKAS